MTTSQLAEDHELLEFKNKLLGVQIGALVVVAFTFVGWGIVEQFKPDFFNPGELWWRTNDLWTSITAFWPLFLYVTTVSIISSWRLRDTHLSEELFFKGSLTSILAGLWEEVGFRCVFIFTAMISIVFGNWAWFVFATLFVIIFIGAIAKVISEDYKVLGLAPLLLGIWAIWYFWTSDFNDPIYWIYQNIIFNALSFFSLGSLDPILYNKEFSFLFIAGAVTANAKFRDGHKYQGAYGVMNSWVVGFVLLYAMMYHGLVVAIVLHALYDLAISVVRYIFRKINR